MGIRDSHFSRGIFAGTAGIGRTRCNSGTGMEMGIAKRELDKTGIDKCAKIPSQHQFQLSSYDTYIVCVD